VDLWWLSATLKGLVAVSYLAVSAAIMMPLARLGQLRRNRLGTATGAIFLTGAIGHGLHAAHPVLSYLELAHAGRAPPGEGLAWHDVLWDALTAAMGIFYWTLRRTYTPLVRGPAMSDDLATRQPDRAGGGSATARRPGAGSGRARAQRTEIPRCGCRTVPMPGRGL
jgi:hypothetical protein